MKPTHSTGAIEVRGSDDWKSELRPWSDATLKLRKARRPEGWRTTPEQLRDRARLGETEAVSSICRMYQELVRIYLRGKYGASRDAADEATQGCFLRLCERSDLEKLVLAPEESFGSWLITRAWYSLQKHWTRERKQQRLQRAPGDDPTPAALAFDEHKARLHFELCERQEDRQDMKSPESILAQASDAKLLERLFARIEPAYRRRRRGLFERVKATLLQRAIDSDGQLDKRASDKWRMKNELSRAAFGLESQDRAQNPQRWLEGGVHTRHRTGGAGRGSRQRRTTRSCASDSH